MRAHFVIGAVGVAVLGVSVATQQNRHLNPMVDLLSAKKAIYGLGVPTAGRGGGNRGGQGAPAGGADGRGGSNHGTGHSPAATKDASRARERCAGTSGSRLLFHRDDGAQHRRRIRDDDCVPGRAGRSRQRRQDAVSATARADQLQGAEHLARGHAGRSGELRHQHQPSAQCRRVDHVVRRGGQRRRASPGHRGDAIQVERRHAT